MTKQIQKQSQSILLTQKMDQSLKVLQMNQIDLNHYLEEQSYEIPIIDIEYSTDSMISISSEEIDTVSKYKIKSESNSYDIIDEKPINVVDYIYSQIRCFNSDEINDNLLLELLEYIDENGLFNEHKEELIQLLKTDKQTIDKLINLIQNCYPKGIGSFSIKEALLHQCVDNSLEYRIINECTKEVGCNRLDLISRKLKEPIDKISIAITNIKKLNPYPLNGLIAGKINYIEPDIIVEDDNINFKVVVNNKIVPTVTISNNYKQLYLCADANTKKYLNQNFKKANDLIDALKLRFSTLELCASYIVSKQEDFFLFGKGYLTPLSLNDIANSLNLSESTISRTLSDKYLECRFGTFPLNYFLSRKVKSATTEDFSADELKRNILDLIEKEDKHHPLSDNEISSILKGKGVIASRRTIVKYRNLLNIQASSKRKIY